VFLLSASAQRSLVAHSRGSGCVIDSTPSEVCVCVLFFSLTCLQKKNENNGQNQTFFGQQHRDTLTQKSEREIKVVQAGL